MTAVAVVLVLGAPLVMLLTRTGRPGTMTARPPNVLLITIDTLRWDRLGSYGGTQGATPVLDRLAAAGTRFETAIAHAPITAPSHASILTGLIPLRHGVRDNGAFVLADTLPSIATVLRGAGYETAAFVSGFPLDRRFGFATGFETYDDRLPSDGGAGRAAYTERRADQTTDLAIAWLDARRGGAPGSGGTAGNRPWFLWVHYFDPHAAYDPPPKWRASMATAYDGEVAFVDEQFGRLVAHLDRLDASSGTIVAVTADHGESLGEHGEETHGVFVYDATLRVPLIVSGPGVSSGLVAPVLARGVDVMPTLVDLAGVPTPGAIDGRSLRPALEGRAMSDERAYVESLLASRNFGWAGLWGFRDRRWKYIEAPEPELYDLQADPGETTNRSADAPDRARDLAQQLGALLDAARAPDVQRAGPAGDRESRARLRALGYVSGSAAPRAAGPLRNPKSGIALINRLERGIARARSDPRRAVEELRAVLAEDPGIAIARSQLAGALSALGQHEAAVAEIRRLQAERSVSAEDLLVLSESLRASGRVEEAHVALSQAAALDPQSPDVALTEARAFMVSRETEKAAAAFSRALDVSPDNPEALLGLGEVSMARGDLAAASSTFERVLARDPSNPSAALRLGLVRGRQGRMEEAIVLLRPLAASTPDNGEALAALAAALARTGRAAEALPYFERAVAAGQRSSAVLNGLGFARLETGDRAGALEALERSLAVNPDQPRVSEAVRDIAARRALPRPEKR